MDFAAFVSAGCLQHWMMVFRAFSRELAENNLSKAESLQFNLSHQKFYESCRIIKFGVLLLFIGGEEEIPYGLVVSNRCCCGPKRPNIS